MPLRAIVRLGWLCIVPLSCAAPRELALPAPAKIFEVLTAPSTAFPVDSSDLIAPFDAQWTWQLVDANGRAIKDPAIQTLASSTALYGATWMVPMIDGDREFLSQGKDDEISLVAVEAPHDQAISYFTPPLILAPSQMHLEELFASSSSMRVYWMMDAGNETEESANERRVLFAGNEFVPRLGNSKQCALKQNLRPHCGLPRLSAQTHSGSRQE